jgi:hypothetical protein
LGESKINPSLNPFVLREWAIPGSVGFFLLSPGTLGNMLDDHRANIALLAFFQQCFSFYPVGSIRIKDEIDREKDRVRIKTLYRFKKDLRSL